MFYDIKEFDKYDMIIVDYKILDKIKDTFKDNDSKLPFLGILNECVIKHVGVDTNTTGYIYFKDLGNLTVRLSSYIYHTKKKRLIHLFDTKFDYKDGGNRAEVKWGLMYRVSQQERKDTLAKTEAMYMGIFGYIHLLQKNKKTVVKYADNENINTHNINPNTSPHHPTKRNFIHIDDIAVKVVNEGSNIIEKFKRHIERHTEAWSVRGHYRKLKDGRQVFVKSYVKGNKEKLKPKDYDIR